MRVAVDYRSSSKDNYINFKKSNPDIKIPFDLWKNIVYSFNEEFKTYILETGEKVKMPGGMGDFSVTKKKRKKISVDPEGNEHINLPVDWVKTREKGKLIYNFNFHSDGYFFGWKWFKENARFKNHALWWFKPSRVTSRLLAHYIKTDPKYQHIYIQWQT